MLHRGWTGTATVNILREVDQYLWDMLVTTGSASNNQGKLAQKNTFAGKKSSRAEIWHNVVVSPSDEHYFPTHSTLELLLWPINYLYKQFSIYFSLNINFGTRVPLKLRPDERAQFKRGSNKHDRCEYTFVWTPPPNPLNVNAAITRATNRFLVIFCRITKWFDIHIWTVNWSIWWSFSRSNVYRVCSQCLHKHHGSLRVFAAFADVCDNKFGAFDICRCHTLVVLELCRLVWIRLFKNC